MNDTVNLNPRLKTWLDRGSVQQLCGHSIFTINDGEPEQPIVLLIHGFPTSSWDWQAVWSALRQDYRLVTLDMLGFGFSDKPNQRDYTIHKQADLFDALIEKLGLEEFHVLAHDYGDTVAQELLARQIDGSGNGKFLSCTFLNGGLFSETHRATRMQRVLIGPFGPIVNKLFGYKQFAKSISAVFGEKTKPSDAELREFWELIQYNHGENTFVNLITYMNDRIQHRARWVHALQQSPVPLAVINGSVDPVSGAHLVERYKTLKCRLDHLTELSQIGHWPQVEAPQEVADAFLEFVGSVDSV